MPYQKDELVVFDNGELKGQTGKFLEYLDVPYAYILVDGYKKTKCHHADFMRQSTMVERYIGFKPLGYIAKDEIIVGFIDQNERGEYLAVRLDDEAVKLTEPLPWGDRITQAIKTNNSWWVDNPVDDLDSLYHELTFIGYSPFEIPEDYTHNKELVKRLQSQGRAQRV